MSDAAEDLGNSPEIQATLEQLIRNTINGMTTDEVQSRERSDSERLRRAAESERAEAEMDKKLLREAGKRGKAIWAGAATILTALITVGAWIYGAGSSDALDERHETEQDTSLETAEENLKAHIEVSKEANAAQDMRIKNLGVLQIEQGTDQRKLLMKAIRPAERDSVEDKSEALKEAETAVLRD